MHKYEGQFGAELSAERSEVQFDLDAVADHDPERITLLGVQQTGTVKYKWVALTMFEHMLGVQQSETIDQTSI